jgi:hypothetical protein
MRFDSIRSKRKIMNIEKRLSLLCVIEIHNFVIQNHQFRYSTSIKLCLNIEKKYS